MNDILTVAEVARLCRVSERTVHRWINHGVRGKKLRADQYGGYRIKREWLEAFGSRLPATEQHRQERLDAMAVLRGEA